MYFYYIVTTDMFLPLIWPSSTQYVQEYKYINSIILYSTLFYHLNEILTKTIWI